ncbi:MAG TPA: 3-dehydroquinate synthase, partial [Candidatus Limnocylindria bacterium]|nr:3-dehydroquinate synthase [Candidatus Limnocylindria bacterium]
MSSTRIVVGDAAGSTPYDVVIGEHLRDELVPMLGSGVRRVALVHPRGLSERAADVRAELEAAGLEVTDVELPDAEAAKTAEIAASCWATLGRGGFTRSDAVVAVGGGATTDLAGFVAATWLRGVRIVHVPTTLLGMVDAAVGGKTGINTAEGKNLVGAFHPPAGVVCDLASMLSLPRPDLASGLAEVVKCGFIADPEILNRVEADPAAALDPRSPALRELVERAIRVKAEVVTHDLRETGGLGIGRELVNYGHTFAHAVERVENYGWRHGDAVSVGMVYVAELSRLAGRLDPSVVTRHRSILGSLDLPLSYPGGRWSQLHAAMRVDKKSRGDRLR